MGGERKRETERMKIQGGIHLFYFIFGGIKFSLGRGQCEEGSLSR